MGRDPKGNDRIPTIHFQVRTVSFREGTILVATLSHYRLFHPSFSNGKVCFQALTSKAKGEWNQNTGISWRIIPVSKLATMVSKSPNWGCSPSKWPKWLVNGGGPNYLLTGGPSFKYLIGRFSSRTLRNHKETVEKIGDAHPLKNPIICY